jgi:WD40 repeat protein/serine/threonine protein kinase
MNPVDGEPLEDQLSALVAAYDEALAAGRLPGPGPESSAPPGLWERLRGLRRLLERLEGDRRRDEGRGTRDEGREARGERQGARDEEAGDFSSLAPHPSPLTRQFGRFQILRELGRGGYGIVFLARDPRLRREVALKLPRPEALLAPELRQRFLREAQVAAGLDHPGIVPVFEVGEVGPVWYIASAYCEGTTLAAWLKEQPDLVAASAAAALVAALAEAMHYTHSRGIVHRDLKPANVLLAGARGEGRETRETAPLREAGKLSSLAPHPSPLTPKITDFGLAKLMEQAGDGTRSGALLGTPAYMAPEQAEGRLQDIGPATDLYALGVILYELLTGRPPFRSQTEMDTLRQVATQDPVAPRRLRGDVPRDLEAVCLKCLEKEPGRRYAEAGALAQDLRRFLAGQPTRARPLPAWKRAGKWARRRPAAAALLAVAALAVAAISGLGGWHYLQMSAKNTELEKAVREADHQRTRAEQRELRARQEAHAARVRLAADLWNKGQAGLVGELLDSLRPAPGEQDLRGFAWHYLWRLAQKERYLRGHHASVWTVAVSPDGRLCASGSADRTVKLWDLATGRLRASLEGHTGTINAVAFSPDGRRLASAAGRDNRGEWKLWDVATGKQQAGHSTSGAEVLSVAFSPDGRTLAVGEGGDAGTGGVRLWDLATGRSRLVLQEPRHVTAVRFSPNGKLLAAACQQQRLDKSWYTVVLLDAATGRETNILLKQQRDIVGLAFAPHGRTLALGGRDETVRLWDVADGKELATFRTEGQHVEALAFSPDGQTLAVAAHPPKGDSVLWLWDTGTRTLRGKPFPMSCYVNALAFAPDGNTLALACGDHLVRLWSPARGQESVALRGHPAEAWAVAFAPDSRTLASASDDHTVKLWDPAGEQERATLRGHKSLVSCLAFAPKAPKGTLLASGGYDAKVKLWDLATGQLQATLEGHTKALRGVAFSPDGKTLASAGRDRVVKLWNVTTAREQATLSGHANLVRSVAFSPDGKALASASHDSTVRLWDVATGQQRVQMQDTNEVWSVAFSPDGTLLAAGNKHGLVRLWEMPSGKERAVLRGHTAGVRSVAFTPDGRTLASGGADKVVRLWHVATRHELLTLAGQSHEVNSVAFSADGRLLAAALHDGGVRLWKATRE